ncbi:MAG: aggregation factor core [Pseudomonadota bacterium]
MLRFAPALALALCPTVASADLAIRFVESAPKDRFVIVNQGACALGETELTIDLSSSAAGLIFDVTGQGAGVEVFQPLELVAGADLVRAISDVADGDATVTLTLAQMAPNAQVAFTVDVDDTAPASSLGQIRVAGSEIEGATATLTSQDSAVRAVFSNRAALELPGAPCLS